MTQSTKVHGWRWFGSAKAWCGRKTQLQYGMHVTTLDCLVTCKSCLKAMNAPHKG